jgi:hypothetical protein
MGPIRTGGINYEPTHGLLGSISTLHLEMRLKVKMGEDTFDLISPLKNCGSGCRENNGFVEILRLAKDGIAPLPDKSLGMLANATRFAFRALGLREPGIQWLVTMEEGAEMVGALDRHTLASGADAKLTLQGRMLIRYQIQPGGKVEHLLSREKPIFEGLVSAWPPRGSTIRLANGPIDYFVDDEVDRYDAKPALQILSNDISFGTDEVSLLATRVQITRGEYVDRDGKSCPPGAGPAGVMLTWTDTRSLVSSSDPPVCYYHVYRRYMGDTLNGWVLVRSSPADITSWMDRANTGAVASEYVVLHAASYPFDYRYENLIGQPVHLQAITGSP